MSATQTVAGTTREAGRPLRPPRGARSPEQAPLFSGGRRHLLDLDDFSREEIEHVLRNADGMKEVLSRDTRKTPALRGKAVLTLFYEASTRTRVSFEQAGKILGADVINVQASGGSTSTSKGESLLNTLKTLQAMRIDALVIRHPDSGAPYFAARHVDASVINAGDGTHAHPTQALLDLYTVRSRLGSIEGAKAVIVGDILYSRVARSNLWGLRAMGAEVTVCAPPTLLPPEWAQGSAIEEGSAFKGVRVTTNIEEALEGADVVMALRIQRERQQAGHLPSLREYSRTYGITAARMKLAKPGALLMHPGPMNEGVEIDTEVAHGPQAVIEEQVSNGVAIRMAVLYTLCSRPKSNG